jgi:hypothetical protein
MTDMRQPRPVRRYALARPGVAGSEDRVRRLRLVRMEEIAEQERAEGPSGLLKEAQVRPPAR